MKRTLLLLLVLSMLLPLAGCAKKGGNTPLEEAYNAVYRAKRKISGFDKECIEYDSSEDSLQIYANSGLDCAAVISVIEKTVAGREVNEIRLNKSHVGWEPAEPLLEAFSLDFTAPVKRLVLPMPNTERAEGGDGDYHVEQPQLWRDSLARLNGVEDVVLNGGTGMYTDYSYLYEIAEGGAIRVPCGVVVTPNDEGINLSGLEVISDLKRLVIGRHRIYRMESARIHGFELLDAATTQVDLSSHRGALEAAKLADTLRTMGFTVIGISDDPRADLDEEAAQSFDSIVAERQLAEALLKEDMSFDERLEGYLSLSYDVTSDMRLEAGIALLKSFYALGGSEAFIGALERMCSYDPDHSTGTGVEKEKSLHEYILKRVCQGLTAKDDYERFMTDVAGALPANGSWCKTALSLANMDGETTETTSLFALMAGYERLMSYSGNLQRILEDDQIRMLSDALDERDLLCGNFNSRFFTGDTQRDIATVNRLLEAGRVLDSQAYQLVFGKVDNHLDTFLHATVLWDAAFGQKELRKYRTDEESLTTDDDRLDIIHYVKHSTDSSVVYDGMRMGQKALFAYLPRDAQSLFFPKDAYRWFEGDDGEKFRAIPPQHTPDSADEAELLVVAWTSYQYSCDYSDGTKGYRCTADAFAYEIGTGKCLGYIGTVVSQPPSSAPAAEKYDVYAQPNLLGLYRVTGRWLCME